MKYKCYVCRVPNRKPSKYRVLDAKYCNKNDKSAQRVEGPFTSFTAAFDRVKIYRGLELLGVIN